MVISLCLLACHSVMMPLEISGFGFHTQVLQYITRSFLYSMALFISWIFIVQFDSKTVI